MEIKVFGPGCSKCTEAEQRVREVASSRKESIAVHKISDFKEMMTAGIMSTPAISIDGRIKCTGRVPSKKEISTWIDEELA